MRLGDVIISDEAGFACSKTNLVKSGLPHLRPFNIGDTGALDFSSLYHVPPSFAPQGKSELLPGDILFNNTNSVELVGKSAIVREHIYAGFSNHLTRIRVDQSCVNPEWLGYWIRRLRATGFFSANATQWVGQAAYRTSDLRGLPLSLPTLEDQHRPVDLLSRAEGIVRLRREAQKKAAEIMPALFIDMFGDPKTNPKSWSETTLGNIVKEFRYGTSQKSGPTGWPTLRIPNVVADRLNPSDMKLVAVPPPELERLRLRDGDLLFVRTNGNPDYVGRTAVFSAAAMAKAGYDTPNCIYASYLIRARLDLDAVNPAFLQVFMASVEGRKRLREQAKTSAGQYNINVDGLSAIRVTLPPIAKQHYFAEKIRQIDDLIALQVTAAEKAIANFSALLTRVLSNDDKKSGLTMGAEAAVA